MFLLHVLLNETHCIQLATRVYIDESKKREKEKDNSRLEAESLSQVKIVK